MKKLLTLLLALMMLLSFAACGGQQDAEGDDNGDSQKETTEDTTEAIPEETTEEPTEETTEAPEVTDDTVVGQVDGQTYVNAFLGIGCQLDDNWAVATQQEAAQLTGLALEPTDPEELLAQSGVFCDFYALYSDGMSSINIMGQQENADSIAMSDEEYMQASEAVIPASLGAVGYTNIQTESGTIEFAGQECGVIYVYASAAGIDLYETLVTIRYGGYIFTITAASYVEDTTADFLANFQAP